MHEFIASPTFRFGIIPFASAFTTVLVKALSKNDKLAPLSKEDLAVGFELALGAIMTCVIYSAIMAQRLVAPEPEVGLVHKLIVAPYVVLAMFGGLICLTLFVRRFGWKARFKMKPLCGIVVPFLYGVFSIYVTLVWIGEDA